MTRVTGPDYAVMNNLIDSHTDKHTHSSPIGGGGWQVRTTVAV